jgi:hypothetical protein
MPDISIVIVNYNVKELLVKCIASILKYTTNNIKYEIIVVDNHSSDGSVDEIKLKFSQVTLIANKFNAGFPHANNQAFAIAKGKYIFMLNPDTEFIDDALLGLYNFAESHPEVSLLAPALLNTDLTHQQSVWRFPTLFYVFCEMHYMNSFLKRKNYSDKNLSKSFEAESFSGAAIFFKKAVFDQIGMLDETMFWIEDVEFCYRAYHANLKLIYYPDIKVIHHVGQSAKKNYKISISNQIFNKIKFFRKHHSVLAYWSTIFLSFYHVFLKLIIFSALSPFNVIYKRKAIAYAYTLPKVFNPPKGIA